jgi:hypothetical protein
MKIKELFEEEFKRGELLMSICPVPDAYYDEEYAQRWRAESCNFFQGEFVRFDHESNGVVYIRPFFNLEPDTPFEEMPMVVHLPSDVFYSSFKRKRDVDKQFMDSLHEEEEQWDAGTVVRVVDSTFSVNRTMDPQEHMRRMNQGLHGMPQQSFKYGDLLIINGYSDSGDGYWDVLFDYFDEKKRGHDYFVCPESQFRRAVVKDDKAWIQSLKEEEYPTYPEDTILYVKNKFTSDGYIRARFVPKRSTIYKELFGQIVKIIFIHDDGHSVYFRTLMDDMGPSDTQVVKREIFYANTCAKDEFDRTWIDSLKEAPEGAPCWVIKEFSAGYAEHGSYKIPFEPTEQLTFLKESNDLVWFEQYGRHFKIDLDTFYECVTFDERDAKRTWLNSLKESTKEEFKQGDTVQTSKEMKAFQCSVHDYNNMSARQRKRLTGYLRPNIQIIFIHDDGAFVTFSEIGGIRWITERTTFYDSTLTKKQAGRKFMDGLKEATSLLPKYVDFEKASDLATDLYQSLCDEHNAEMETGFEGRATRDVGEKCYWNPATNEFVIHVIDAAPGSHDDGVWCRIDPRGVVTVIDKPPGTNPLSKLTNDPKMLKKIEARAQKSKNRWIEFDPDEDDLP